MGWTFAWRAREKPTNSERILGGTGYRCATATSLFSNAVTRALETSASQTLPTHALMEKAGLAVAQLALAVAPHAHRIWIVCGPGNNGGDGLVAARYLQQWGKAPLVSYVPGTNTASDDSTATLNKARQAQVTFTNDVPADYALCIDALFGIGLTRSLDGRCAALVAGMNAKLAPVIAVDVPSGLDADTGTGGPVHVEADYTLSLLTLKPGLFTADGRDACGEIWFNALDVPAPPGPCALLNPQPDVKPRNHNTHKGSYGDVAVVGGAPGMVGAALLAAKAALHGGAGRVYIAPLDPDPVRVDLIQPELMFRSIPDLAYDTLTVVAGCGGGSHIAQHLATIMQHAKRLVLDADALNAISQSTALQSLLKGRGTHSTVLTPHPLEAARLLGTSCADVQANRVKAAQTLANNFGCTVVLKGSGTVIAAPQRLPHINVTGNAKLASPGTGDVLAGLIGARLAADHDPFQSSCEATFLHGQIADDWCLPATMTAQDLVHRLHPC